MKSPKSWSDISINQFKEIKSSELDLKDEILMLSIILDIPIAELEEMDIKDLIPLTQGLSFLNTELPKQPKSEIIINDETFHLKDLNTITVGEFIDLEHFFMADYIENLNSIVAILYRRKLASNDYFKNDELEPYGNWLHHRATIMNDAVGVGDVFGIVNKYLSFRANIFKLYEGLFDGGDEDIDDEEEEDIDEEETNKPQQKDNSGKWGWDIMLLKIANNDALKIEDASNIPLIQAFNVLAMRKELKIE